MAAVNSSRGQDLAQRLARGTAQANRSPLPGARDLPVLHGVTPGGLCADSLENVTATARQILLDSGGIFRYGASVVYEVCEGEDGKLIPLADGPHVVAAAPSLLSNIFVCEQVNLKTGAVTQFAPPSQFVSILLNGEPTMASLPSIKTYAKRPVFDEHFTLLGPGWHPESGILVHGPAIEPVITPVGDPGHPIRDRLPRHLGVLFNDFCFRSDADAANAVGAMLTGLLMSHFLSVGKALVLLDGNQPGIGKTLLARVFGIVHDGIDPQLINYTPDDEELAKRICATLRGSPQSILLLDNAKTKAGGAISSPVIEANSMAAQVSLRILGESANYTRPNDILWCLTMNDTRTSPDLVSRGLPIRFRFEGDPAKRKFGGRDPIDYARQHRVAILGELAGMVIRWSQLGRPRGKRSHRLTRWAEVIGGILGAAGLPEFLENLDEAAASFNVTLDELAALAEAVVKRKDGKAFIMQGTRENPDVVGDAGAHPGLLPNAWVENFRAAKVLVEKIDGARSERARTTIIGTFLAQNRDREVPIEVGGCTGRAKLSHREVGKRQTAYIFHIVWDGPGPLAAGGPSNLGGSPRLIDVVSPPQPAGGPAASDPPDTKSGVQAADRDAGDDPDHGKPGTFANEEIW